MRHQELINALKKYLKLKGITYLQLGEMLEISEKSVQRIFSDGTFTLERFVKVCEIVGLTVGELALLEERGGTGGRLEYTKQQEEFLARPENKNYLAFYLQLQFNIKVEEIVSKFAISENHLVKILAGLEKLDLIEWLPGNKIRRTSAQPLYIASDGPIAKAHKTKELNLFLKPFIKGTEECSFLTGLRFSKNAQEKWKKQFQEMMEELRKETRMEVSMDIPTEDMTFLLAFKPHTADFLERFDFSKW